MAVVKVKKNLKSYTRNIIELAGIGVLVIIDLD